MANLWDPVLVYDSSMAGYWEDETMDGATNRVPLPAAGVTGSIMEVRFTRSVAAAYAEDIAMFRLCFSVEAGPGAPMSRLDASDATRVEAAFSTNWWNSMKTVIANDWQLKEFAWRHFGADFPQDATGVSKPGPYWRVTSLGSFGTDATARLPDQVALTTTFRTASRKHWGRFYAGGFTVSSCDDTKYGHAKSSTVDMLSNGSQAFVNDIYGDARVTWLVIWSAKYRGALAINEISVDDTWDVIRSRRNKQPFYRKTYTS